MIDLHLRGPLALLHNADDVPLLWAHATAWQPELYIWALAINRSHRITCRYRSVGRAAPG